MRDLGGALGDAGGDPTGVLRALADAAREGTVATQGGRYFGFVVGSSLPVATATDWLVSAWDQNAGIHVLSPLAAVLEQVVTAWILGLVGLPKTWSAGYVTGGMMANFTSLAAARHHVLAAVGWDVEGDGLIGSPPIDVFVSEEAHYSIANTLRMQGIGANRARRVPTDAQGRMRVDALETMLADTSGPCIVSAQAGNVNTGAFDPIDRIADLARARGAWLHVDAAFGLWAAASPALRHQLDGIERADSIGTDAHKWLNVPYDCGIALCAHPDSHRAAMTIPAPYIVRSPLERDAHEFTPEESRRARAVPIYAVLKTLGRSGLREMIERCCRHARRFGEGLRAAGYDVLNDVVLNQVLVAFGSAETTKRVIEAIQRDGTCWCGGTEWQGKTAMRISVSSWATTDEDVERSLKAMLAAARTAGAAGQT
ncbi:MAG TPA: aminotransferase class V-fold PLP-dependent enzyme [Gemmatimonadales bacterium]|nr:aminotransferase class V-fold PLP-dependent enzyme [Gemmatimonadales bacterium]